MTPARAQYLIHNMEGASRAELIALAEHLLHEADLLRALLAPVDEAFISFVQKARLGGNERQLVRLLWQAPSRFASYDRLLDEFCPDADDPLPKLKALVKGVRAKLGRSSPYIIEFVRGEGYRLLERKQGGGR